MPIIFANMVFRYVYVAVSSCVCGMVISLSSTYINVEFVKRIDEAYLARAAGIMSALSMASIPLALALVGLLTAVVKMEWLFSVTGILAIAMCPFFLRSKVLKEKKESANIQETQFECTV